MFVFLCYINPLFAPLSVFFFPYATSCTKSYNRLNVLALAFVPVLSGISRDIIPFSPVPVQPRSVLVLSKFCSYPCLHVYRVPRSLLHSTSVTLGHVHTNTDLHEPYPLPQPQMSRANTPSPLSSKGLRYTAQELEILTRLSALNVDNFVNHTDPPAAATVFGGFRTMALGLLRNPHLPTPNPSVTTRLRTKRDEARARNNVLEGQVCTLENERTPMMAEGSRLTEQAATLNETIQELQSDNNA